MEYKYELIRNDENLPIKIIVYNSITEHQFVPRHWHETIEIIYVIAGQVDEIYIDGVNYTARDGDVVLVNSNAIHSVFVNQDKNFKGVNLFIPIEFLKENYDKAEQIIFDCITVHEKYAQRLKQFDELRNVFDSIAEVYEHKENDSFASVKLKALSYTLIYVLLTYFKADCKTRSGVIKTEKYLNRLTEITSYIKENYNQDLTIEMISKKFNLSSAYLSRFFAKHMGMTVLDYINAVRLEKSYRDLLNTDNAIVHIALEHGFPNEKSFNRVFKEVYQVTPSQYRKENKGQDLTVNKAE